MGLGWILFITFCFMVFFVGGYMFLMLNVMRADPSEQKFRKDQGDTTHTIIPKKEPTEEK
ncbi:MAG: Unknown protein [uncultured Sulfurovum sp.]|uniref:Uncharacterized protein n=1 Tax=uncultured Sulfurovum sp. TaxID=269237 RepID=A0A6S6TCC0_9BACT|nr:MAG: Unknown protein [uncultured Sulfurovum sp.]